MLSITFSSQFLINSHIASVNKPFCTGVDLSTLVSEAEYKCMHSQHGIRFVVPRGFQSTGRVDPNVVQNIRHAKAAGIPVVDVYLFPCAHCGNPAGQAHELINAIRGTGHGMVWIDIETYPGWSSNHVSNRNFITAMANALKADGASVGIYTSAHNWESLVGLEWAGVSQHDLWYAHYDNNPSFGDFKAFGGWHKPTIKQYRGTSSLCGAGVDMNWHP